MARSVPLSWVRLATLALLGSALMGLDARPARAGCHVAERPTFGLSRADEIVPGFGPVESAERPPSRVAPKPCTGDVPGGLQQQNPPGLVALIARERFASRPGVALPRPTSTSARPIHLPTGMDRPPRSSERTA